jgi:tRNA (adenine22-N1)-methyltransferase
MLSKRLFEISKYVENGSMVADIGCDHALLSIFLVEEQIAAHCIASDINQGPINNAKSNIAQKNLNHLITTRLGPGLETIKKGEANVCIISGMGGTLIKDILNQSNELFLSFDVVITQANNANYQLRKFMSESGFIIEDESLVEENEIIYEVIKFSKGNLLYSDIELKYGPILLKRKGDLFKKYIAQILANKKRIFNQIPETNAERRNDFLSEISELENI